MNVSAVVVSSQQTESTSVSQTGLNPLHINTDKHKSTEVLSTNCLIKEKYKCNIGSPHYFVKKLNALFRGS